MKRARRTLGLLIVGVFLLAGCGGSGGGGGGESTEDPDQPPDEPVTIKIGWNPSISGVEQNSLLVTNPELAPNLGTWYDLEFTEFPGTPQIVQGLAAGSLDVGSGGQLAFANALDQGADIVLTNQYIEEREGWGQTLWLVGKDSGINSIADLEGKTVATNSVGSYVDYVADYHLRENGLEANLDYEKVEIPFPQQQDALAAGQTDVGVFVAVFAPGALETGEFKQLFTSLDVQPFIIALQGFRREFVEEHPVTVQKFLEDYLTMTRYIADEGNRQVVVESFAETSQTPVEQADSFLLTKQDLFRTPDAAVDVERLQQNWDFFREAGAFQSRLKVEDHIVPELLPDQE